MNLTVKTSGHFSNSRGLRASVPFFPFPHPLPSTFLLLPHFSRGSNAKNPFAYPKFRSLRTGMLATQANLYTVTSANKLCSLRMSNPLFYEYDHFLDNKSCAPVYPHKFWVYQHLVFGLNIVLNLPGENPKYVPKYWISHTRIWRKWIRRAWFRWTNWCWHNRHWGKSCSTGDKEVKTKVNKALICLVFPHITLFWWQLLFFNYCCYTHKCLMSQVCLLSAILSATWCRKPIYKQVACLSSTTNEYQITWSFITHLNQEWVETHLC